MPDAEIVQPITQPNTLLKLARRLESQPILGVDTESNSLFAYREQVCLIQFSTPSEDALVDPLALPDLTPLAGLFENPRIEKIFHAAEYDLICLKRDFGFSFANLFDTMLAARLLGRKEVGLGAVIEAEFGLHVDKRNQRADWGRRPLEEDLLAYATLDTHYLIPLRDILKKELEEKGLTSLAEEDFQRLCRTSVPPVDDDAHAWWRVGGSHELTPQQAAVLQELCNYRARVAQQVNRPLFKVFGDKTIIAIAVNCPGNLRDLGTLPGMSPKQVNRHGRALLGLVQRGLEAEPLAPPRPTRPDERYLNRLDALREWRKEKGKQTGVDSDVILPRELLTALANENPLSEEALGEVMCEYPWRREKFGAEILQVLVKSNNGGKPKPVYRRRGKRNHKKQAAGGGMGIASLRLS
jgi:ribonuclease D